jgi:hypothetical protein
MPWHFELENIPAGCALEDATGVAGTPAPVIIREFVSSDQGEVFLSRVEGITAPFLGRIAPEERPRPETVFSLAAIIHRDKNVDLYVNELNFVVSGRATRSIEPGQTVTVDDLVDVEAASIDHLEIPPNTGICLLFSVGWRKGLFFDFEPLHSDGLRDYNLEALLGSFFAYLSNQSVYNISEATWDAMVANSWFPFAALPKRLLDNMVGRASRGSDIDVLVQEVFAFLSDKLPGMLDAWRTVPEFDAHIDLLETAVERYVNDDFVSCVSIVFPRIEGLLRATKSLAGIDGRATQKRLSGTIIEVSDGRIQPFSWLLVERFRWYLEKCYFADFRQGEQATLSRHSVGHGVANSGDFDSKHSSIGFLILHQLYYIIKPFKAEA